MKCAKEPKTFSLVPDGAHSLRAFSPVNGSSSRRPCGGEPSGKAASAEQLGATQSGLNPSSASNSRSLGWIAEVG